MTILKWSPMEEVELLRKQIDHIFTPYAAPYAEASGARYSPPVSVVEGENYYTVEFMLPGLSSDSLTEQITIEATTKTLTLSGEIPNKALAAGETVLFNQFRSGAFFKQLSFPDGIQHEEIEATYRNGMLMVKLPKAAAAQKKTISIQVN